MILRLARCSSFQLSWGGLVLMKMYMDCFHRMHAVHVVILFS
jgi:hypothetical protein